MEFYSCRDDTELANLEDDQFDVVKIESQYQVFKLFPKYTSVVLIYEVIFQIALNAPKDSNTFKNSVNGAGALCHRFVFNKIFPPETQQEQLFLEMVKVIFELFIFTTVLLIIFSIAKAYGVFGRPKPAAFYLWCNLIGKNFYHPRRCKEAGNHP